MDRFDRIYRLHNLLTNRRTPIPLTVIMKELECAKASATRYIDDMRTYLDAPLEYDRKLNGYYSTTGNMQKSPTNCPDSGSAPKNSTAC